RRPRRQRAQFLAPLRRSVEHHLAGVRHLLQFRVPSVPRSGPLRIGPRAGVLKLRVITSTSAAARLSLAARFLDHRPPGSEVLIVGASRGAADDLARSVASRLGATFGITRFSLTELAARAASTRLARERRAPASQAGGEAVAARVVFDAVAAEELEYFGPVASMPGFPKALARTLHELRLARVSADRLAAAGTAGADIGRLLARMEAQLDRASVDDRAALFRAAAEAFDAGQVRWAGLPVVLLDVTADSQAERDLIVALLARAPEAMVTFPDGDERTRDALARLGSLETESDAAAPDSDLWHLRHYVFTNLRPPERARRGDVRLFSAPGEGREAVEIVRRVLDEASRGVRFDDMAVFLRTPQQYLGLLDH